MDTDRACASNDLPTLTAPVPRLAEGAPAALDTFLRQVERRAMVFAELLCGDADRGVDALALAMHAFRNAAARGPIEDWTQRFWSLLLAVPSLRAGAPDAAWPASMAALARLPTGLRAAVLLRLVAGLDEAAAAAALDIAPPTYRAALERAWPRRPNGSPDVDAWRALVVAAQSGVRELPAARLVRLAQLRERAIHGCSSRPGARGAAPRANGSHRSWLRPALRLVGAVSAVAFAATFLLPSTPQRDDVPPIQTRPLPAAAPPAATFDRQTALLTHPDFDQLADTRDTAIIADLDFYAWYAARLAAQPATMATPLVLPDAGAPLMPGSHGAH